MKVHHKLLAKFEHFSKAFDLLYNNDKKKEGFIDKFQKLLEPKADLEFVKQKVQEARVQLKNKIQLEIAKLRQANKELQSKNEKNCQGLENRLKEVEKKTIGRIGECETLLQKKASFEYVDKASEQLQSKLSFEVQNIHKNGANDALFKINELRNWVQNNFNEVSNGSREMRTRLKQMEQILKGVERKEKADSLRKDLESRLHEVTVKVLRLEGLQDSEMQARIGRQLQEIRFKLNETSLMANDTARQFTEVSKMMADSKGMNVADPHKICTMDSEIKRLRTSVDKHGETLSAMDYETKMKLLAFEEKIMDNLALVKNQQNQVSKMQLHETIGRLRESTSQQFSDLSGQTLEIHKKLAKFELFQRTTKKKIKDLTANEENKAQLALKMDLVEGRGGFDRVGAKFGTVDETLDRLRTDTDVILQFVNKLQQQMGTYEEGISIISGKQKIVPQKCISCGTKHRGTKPSHELMGVDGRFYRVDIKGCNAAFDSPEVYDVMPAQMSFVPQTGARRDRIASSKRSTLQNTNSGLVGNSFQTTKSNFIRPHSAAKG